jgi:regulatory protein
MPNFHARFGDGVRPALAFAAAYTRAVRILGARPMSSAAMRGRLERAGAEKETAIAVVDRLVAERWIDDTAYAAGVARRGFVDQGWSERRIRLSLRRAGIDPAVQDEALARVAAEVDGPRDAKLLRLAERKWKSLLGRQTADARVRRQRFTAWLARRGFSGDEVRRLVEHVTGKGVASG